MKKLLLLIALISMFLPSYGASYELMYEYNDADNTAVVTGYTGTISGMLTINKYADSHIVVGIASNAFAGCETMTGVTLPADLKWIGENAFLGCIAIDRVGLSSSLQNWMNVDLANEYSNPMCYGADFYDQDRNQYTSLTLPTTATEVKPYSFYGANLTGNLNLRGEVTKIGKGAFWNCGFKNAMTFPAYLTEIGEDAFTGNAFSSVTFEEGQDVLNINNNKFSKAKTVSVYRNLALSNIGESPFVRKVQDKNSINYKTSVTTVNIGGNVSYLPSQIFAHCNEITSLNISEAQNLRVIGDSAFYYNTKITDLILPEGLEEIGKSAFEDCYALKNVQLPSSLATMGKNIFEGCQHLPRIAIPEKITKIPDYAFYGCSNMTHVDLPEGLKEIGMWAFAYIKDDDFDVLIYPAIEVIGHHAFAYCRYPYINFIYGAPNLRYIGDYMLGECDRPTVVGLDFNDCKKLEYIGYYAFHYVHGIKELVLVDCPDLTKIGDKAFRSSSLERVEINNCPKLEYLGQAAFYNSNSLTSMTLKNVPALTFVGGSLFYNCYKLNYVDFSGYYFNEIPIYMFRSTRLKELILPEDNNLVSIGEGAFYTFDSPGFDFSIFKNVETIGREAFYGYNDNTVVDLSGMTSLTSIGQEAFSSNAQLEKIILPATLKNVDYRFLSKNNSLKEVVSLAVEPVVADRPLTIIEGVNLIVPEGSEPGYATSNWSTVSSINNYPVIDNTLQEYVADGITYDIDITSKTASVVNSVSNLNLESALIPYALNGGIPVTSIGNYAFNNSQALELVKLPFTISSIGTGAFSGCSNLNEVLMMPATPPTLGENVFNGIDPEAEVMVRPNYLEAYEDDDNWASLPLVAAAEIPVDELRIIFAGKTAEEISVNVGQNIRLFANLFPLNHTQSDLNWNCQGLDFEVLDNGIFECTPQKAGTYNVSLSVDNLLLLADEENTVSANCVINVKDILPTGLSLSDDSEIYAGLEKQLEINWLPLDVTNPVVEFASSDPEILSVSETGVIKGLKPGFATVSATSPGSKGLLLANILIEVKPFTLTFDCGAYSFTQEYAANAPIILPEEPVVYGCEFGGWDGLPENMLMPAEDLTVYPILLVNKYKVTFLLDGVLFETQQYEAGETVVAPEVTAPVGLLFSGWTPELPEEMPDYDLYFHGTFDQVTGIDEINKDQLLDKPVDIYNMNGLLVKKNVLLHEVVDVIPSGIYVVTSGDKAFKIKI